MRASERCALLLKGTVLTVRRSVKLLYLTVRTTSMVSAEGPCEQGLTRYLVGDIW